MSFFSKKILTSVIQTSFVFVLAAGAGAGFAKTRPAEELKSLGEVSPFSDIVVIQRRFLSKTGRFEISPSAFLFLNSEFYLNVGAGGNIGFYFLEKHGVEITGAHSFAFARDAALKLENHLGFKGKTGGDQAETIFSISYKWIPLYGKISWMNRKIIPFDTFLTLGAGVVRAVCSNLSSNDSTFSDLGLGVCDQTGVSADGSIIRKKWEPAVVLGAGQSFSVSRNSAVRFNVKWIQYGFLTGNVYRSEFSIGSSFSFYLPEKKVR